MKLPFRILVLDDDENALSGIVEFLHAADYDVTSAASYDAGKRLLAATPFDLLITDVRLRGFNGLNLVKQMRVDHADMAVIIITGYDEPLLELEASRYHAMFVRKPIRPNEFLTIVSSALANVRRERRWPRKRVLGGFRVTAAGRPAAVVDVSYGGLRLEVPSDSQLPATFDVELSGIGLQLKVEPVWSCPSDNNNYTLLGASLSANKSDAADTWRTIVDRLSA